MLYIADKIPCSGHGSVDMPHLVGQAGQVWSDPDTGSSPWGFVVFILSLSLSLSHTHTQYETCSAFYNDSLGDLFLTWLYVSQHFLFILATYLLKSFL